MRWLMKTILPPTVAGRQRVERIERSDFEDLCLDAFVGRADAAAERDGDQRLRRGTGEGDLGVTANPAGHEHVLAANLREAEAAELVQRPAHGRRIAARARGTAARLR